MSRAATKSEQEKFEASNVDGEPRARFLFPNRRALHRCDDDMSFHVLAGLDQVEFYMGSVGYDEGHDPMMGRNLNMMQVAKLHAALGVWLDERRMRLMRDFQ